MIPKIIHFCWLSGDPYPELVENCIRSWKTKLPDYEFMLWDTNRFDITSTIWTQQAFDAKKYAFAADYIRLYALYHYGGIYLDTDVQVLKSFDDLLHLPYFMGNQFDGYMEAAIIGTEKHQKWTMDCLGYYADRPFIRDDGSQDTIILPAIIEKQIEKTRSIYRLSDTQAHNISELIEDQNKFLLLPSGYFSPKDFKTKKISKTENTYTVHHFDSAWLSNLNKLRLSLERLIGDDNAEKIIRYTGIRKLIKGVNLEPNKTAVAQNHLEHYPS
ncbi:glycosyl transferase [Hyunsoonleella sp. SJ7]|uniref:Glycosyl transferase n=1 Tax=Hyunsoonleella aquatilis TaxID=2762758 RepID=A0A923HGG4_9FLAO|nr:glycosyltransferase [Hyunsoonleella aquatilis]MBC3759838.1 glycosyl transferase [Hyunsoonleella aquatilis]